MKAVSFPVFPVFFQNNFFFYKKGESHEDSTQ